MIKVELREIHLSNIIHIQTKRNTFFEFFKNLLLNLNYLFKKCKIDNVTKGVNLFRGEIFLGSIVTSQLKNISDRDLLVNLYSEVLKVKELIHSIPNWISVSDVSNHIGLSNDSVRNRVVYSGDYENNVDYKYIGKRLVINKNVLHTLKRLRKPKKVSK